MLSFRHLMTVVLLAGLQGFLVACPSKNEAPPVEQRVEIPIKGDPSAFVKNALGNTTSKIPKSILKKDSQWVLIQQTFIGSEQEQKSIEESMATDQAPAPKETAKLIQDNLIFHSLKPADNTSRFEFMPSDSKGISMVLKEDGDEYALESIRLIGTPAFLPDDFEVLHYSVKKNHEAFSILYRFREGTTKFLIAAYFTLKKEKNILEKIVDEAYNYMFGTGVLVGWDQKETLDVKICAQGAADHYKESAQKGIERWRAPLEGRLNISSHFEPNSCPPFSDMNTQTIVHVSDWVERYSPRESNPMMTLLVPDFFDSKIIDSDIFVIEKEWDKSFNDSTMAQPEVYNSPVSQTRYEEVMAHEFGHTLGLGHVFDGRPSVMSYEDISQIFDYDYKAVETLYPLIDEED